MSAITAVTAREIFNSRGYPSLQVRVCTAPNLCGQASAAGDTLPASLEAAEFGGLGQAVQIVQQKIAPTLQGMDCNDQQAIDHELSELNAGLSNEHLAAVSLAVLRAAAATNGIPLYRQVRYLSAQAARIAQAEERTASSQIFAPTKPRLVAPDALPRLPLPHIQILAASEFDSYLDCRDLSIAPLGASSLREGLSWSARVFHQIGDLLAKKKYPPSLVTAEGGFAPPLKSVHGGLRLLVQAIEMAQLRPGQDVGISINVAANQFYQDEQYVLRSDPNQPRDAQGMMQLLSDWVKEFPIFAITDALAAEDWPGWHDLSKTLGRKVWLIGGDVFGTNQELIWRGTHYSAGNIVQLKPSQAGTVSETLRALCIARMSGYGALFSTSTVETADTTLCDLAVGTGAGQIALGSLTRSERTEKLNRLLELEELLTR